MTMEAVEKPVNDTETSETENTMTNNNNNNNNNQSKAKEDNSGEVERDQPTGEPSTDKEESEQDQTVTEGDDETEDLVLEDTSNYDTDERSLLFQKGLDYEKKGKQKLALKCYFGCMKGLKRKTNFVLLPQCLHNIADIYQAQGNFERAIHFAQAEKLFYESALIETQEIQKKIEEIASSENYIPTDINELNIEAMRAEEYEHLARLCLDNEQAQLALEYAGKCAKIRQHVYGDNHAKTKETLDFFASLYAEVGKEQYSDSFNLLNSEEEKYEAPEVIMSPSPGGEPVSILRQRISTSGQKKDEGSPGQADREKKQVRFHESVELVEDNSHRHKEEIASLTVTLILLVVCFLILMALGLWLYCSLGRGHTCYLVSSKIKSWVTNVQYYFHSRTAPKVAYQR